MRLSEIAKRLRMPLSNLSAINSGSRSVSIRLLSRIAELLNCSAPELFEESESSGIFRQLGLDQEIARIEMSNPMGTDKAWVHRLMLANRDHYARVREPEICYGKK